MAFDEVNGEVLLFGGTASVDSCSSYLGDTWSYTTTNRTWTLLTPANSPSARSYSSMVYDSDERQIVLYGGETDCTYEGYKGRAKDEVYTWNGSTWSSPMGGGPTPRYNVSMAYDADRNRTVLFGGYVTWLAMFGGTWEWDNPSETWTDITPATEPSRRLGSPLVFDPIRHSVILFGGNSFEDNMRDTWEHLSGVEQRAAGLWQIAWYASGAGDVALNQLDLRIVAVILVNVVDYSRPSVTEYPSGQSFVCRYCSSIEVIGVLTAGYRYQHFMFFGVRQKYATAFAFKKFVGQVKDLVE